MRKTLFLILLTIMGNIFLIGQATGGGVSYSSSMSPLVLIVGIFFTVMGMLVIALAHVFLAIREIALNTRSEKDPSKENYGALLTICPIMKITGWIIIIAGWVIPIALKL
jgi:cytochrome bd-type quinol oxidase subunit 1